VNNLIVNGSFENTDCTPWPAGDRYCPNSSAYSCDLANWTCTGGGVNTYACTLDGTYIPIVDGSLAVYFGNSFCNVCSGNVGDTSCFASLGCSMAGLPQGFPYNDPSYGGANGVSIKQTVNGLNPGDVYVLEFWAGGEWSYTCEGLFALDVGFGDTLLRCKPTGLGAIGTRYVVVFIADTSSQTIKFTNWGHIGYSCTELVLDNVRLYPVAQLSPSVPLCIQLSSSSSFAASDTDICEKFCVNFYDSSQNNPIAWQWQFPGGNPSSSTDQNPANICYDVPGLYDVTLITTNANGTDTLTLPNYITVFATPPFPTITQVGYTLTSSASSSYQWQFNSYDIPGATNQSYDVMQTGYYTVIVGDSNSCKNSTTTYVLISGIDEADDSGIFVYPNASSGNFMIDVVNAPADAGISIDVVNSLGQNIFSSVEKTSFSSFKKEIDLTEEASGVYFIHVKTNDVLVSRKIIITK
jgi:PKD repeat protein